MSLANYVSPTTKITGGLTVRGLSFVDVSALAKDHYKTLALMFDGIDANVDINIKKIVGNFGPTAPPLLAAVIAYGCGEPDMIEVAATIPLGIQIEAVTKIVEMTFAVEGGAKQVFQMVMAAMDSARAVMTDSEA